MNKLETLVENHYHTPGLFEDILARLKEQGIDKGQVLREHIAGVDEFHVRGAAVSRELAEEIRPEGLRILDLGCGLGGPSRMLAAEYGCSVVGIDLSHEYIKTANALSRLVGLQEKTRFIQGSALDLPFQDESFDVVWTQHVQMNIEDKLKFYSEVQRVLAAGGRFAYYDIFRKNGEDLYFPLPWADEPSLSYLITSASMKEILQGLGFKSELGCSQTSRGIEFLKNLFDKLKQHGPPKLGLNVLMGHSTIEKLNNILRGLNEGKIELYSGIFRKELFTN